MGIDILGIDILGMDYHSSTTSMLSGFSVLNTNKSPPEGRKGILVTTSFDLNKAKISVVAIGNSLVYFPFCASSTACAIFFICRLDFYLLILHFIEIILLLTTLTMFN